MPSRKKRPVMLTDGDRHELLRITTTGVHPASMIRRARVLLALDTSVGLVDPEEVIAARVEVSCETLRLVAKRLADPDGRDERPDAEHGTDHSQHQTCRPGSDVPGRLGEQVEEPEFVLPWVTEESS